MEWVTANLHVLVKINPTEYSSKLLGFPTVPWFAVCWSDLLCLFTETNRGERQLKYHDCKILSGNTSMDRTSGDVSKKTSHGPYTEEMLQIKSSCMVSITIPSGVMAKHRLCYVQVDQMYQSWHKRCSLPPCSWYLEMFNILPNNKFNTKYHVLHSKTEPLATTGGYIRQINTASRPMPSTSHR